jgi:integrase
VRHGKPKKNSKTPLYVRYRYQDKNKYRYIRCDILECDWDVKLESVSKNAEDFLKIKNAYETTVDSLMDELELENPEYRKTDTLFYYMQGYMDYVETRFKLNTFLGIRTVFMHVRNYCKGKDIKLSRMDRRFLEELYFYLSSKTKTASTANTYYEKFVTFIRWLEDYHEIEIKHKFMLKLINRDHKKKKIKSNVHFDELIEKINDINSLYTLTNFQYLNLARYMLAYSLYGMRASDVILIKWSNFYVRTSKVESTNDSTGEFEIKKVEDIYINYTMYKTGSEIEFRLNPAIYKYLFFFADRDLLLELGGKYKDNHFNCLADKYERGWLRRNFKSIQKEHEESMADTELQEGKEAEMKRLLIRQIKEAGRNKRKDSFVTNFVREEYLNRSKKEREKYMKCRGNHYNESLKLALKKLGMDTFSTHTARYTFVYDSLKNSVDFYSISSSLGHKSMETTDKYVSRFNADLLSDKMDKTFRGL